MRNRRGRENMKKMERKEEDDTNFRKREDEGKRRKIRNRKKFEQRK